MVTMAIPRHHDYRDYCEAQTKVQAMIDRQGMVIKRSLEAPERP